MGTRCWHSCWPEQHRISYGLGLESDARVLWHTSCIWVSTDEQHYLLPLRARIRTVLVVHDRDYQVVGDSISLSGIASNTTAVLSQDSMSDMQTTSLEGLARQCGSLDFLGSLEREVRDISMRRVSGSTWIAMPPVCYRSNSYRSRELATDLPCAQVVARRTLGPSCGCDIVKSVPP